MKKLFFSIFSPLFFSLHPNGHHSPFGDWKKLMKMSFTFVLFLISLAPFAQTPPEGINYQAIARDTTGKPLINSVNLSVKFTIWDSITGGDTVFSETHTSISTNRYGLFTLVIGSTNNSDFTAIQWETGNKFLEVAIDSGGTGFVTMPYRTQMMSVPYALYAKTSGTTFTNTSWSLLGNATTATNFLGTTNSAPLLFKTNNSLGMIIDSAGNTGIGTAAPSTQLHTTGGVRFQTLNGTGNRFVEADNNGNLSAVSATASGIITGNGTNNYIPKWTPNGTTLGNSSIFDNGNIGIGTTTPVAELEVVSTSNSAIPRGIIGTVYNNDATRDAQLWLRRARGTDSSPSPILNGDEIGSLKFRGYDGSGSNGFSTNDQTEIVAVASQAFSSGNNGSYLKFMTTPNNTINGIERMRIDHNGNVGIGTTTAPSATLDVNGTINLTGTGNTNELNRTQQTGTANLVPIAYGNVASDGSVNASTGNIAVSWVGGSDNRYEIAINNETYVSTAYITIVTVIGDTNSGVKVETGDDGSGKLTVTIRNAGLIGPKTPNAFQFITYKP